MLYISHRGVCLVENLAKDDFDSPKDVYMARPN